MGKIIEMEVFRAGKQTDAAGNTKDWSEKDLDNIISKSKEMKEDIPATLGHPKDNSPAFGWFKCKDLFRKGKSLFAKLGDMTKEFEDSLKRKNFKNRSIALRPDFSIRHIAFLGGAMPAVKGMAALKFNDDEEFNEYEFDFGEHETPESFAEKVLSILFKKKEDLKTPEENMDYKEQFEAEKAKNEQLTADLDKAKTDLESAGKDEDGKSFKEKFEEEKKRAEELQGKIEKAEVDAKTKEYSDFAESLVKDEKILPAEKEAVIAMQKTLDGQEPIDFKEGDETVKKTPLEIYKKSLEAKSVGGLFGAKFGGEASPQHAIETEIRNKTEEIMEKDNCTFGEASKKLMEKEPGLFKNLKFTEEKPEDS